MIFLQTFSPGGLSLLSPSSLLPCQRTSKVLDVSLPKIYSCFYELTGLKMLIYMEPTTLRTELEQLVSPDSADKQMTIN